MQEDKRFNTKVRWQYSKYIHWTFPPVIFGALQVTKVFSTEEVKRAIEGSGKDFGKSISNDTFGGSGYSVVVA